jgi:hypothetical protein
VKVFKIEHPALDGDPRIVADRSEVDTESVNRSTIKGSRVSAAKQLTITFQNIHNTIRL